MPGLKLIALKPVMVVGTTTLVLPTTKRGIGVGAGVGGVGAGVGGAGVGGAGVGGNARQRCTDSRPDCL